jgi:hypothetical protein
MCASLSPLGFAGFVKFARQSRPVWMLDDQVVFQTDDPLAPAE